MTNFNRPLSSTKSGPAVEGNSFFHLSHVHKHLRLVVALWSPFDLSSLQRSFPNCAVPQIVSGSFFQHSSLFQEKLPSAHVLPLQTAMNCRQNPFARVFVSSQALHAWEWCKFHGSFRIVTSQSVESGWALYLFASWTTGKQTSAKTWVSALMWRPTLQMKFSARF